MDVGFSRFLIWIALIPLLGGVFIGLLCRRKTRLAVFISTGLVFLVLLLVINSGTLVLPWQTQHSFPDITWTRGWISDFNLHVNLVLDGFAGWMIIMTAISAITCLLFASFAEPHPSIRRITTLLVITSGAIGVFIARDILSFIVSWGLWLLIPFCVDSRQPDRQRLSGTLKFFVFHFLSFLFITAGLAIVHFNHFQPAGIASLDVSAISRISIPVDAQKWIMLFLLIGFGIRMPLFPFHSWLSDVLDEMPGSVAALVTSTGLVTSIYAVLRIVIPLCPDACLDYNKYIVLTALLSTVYGALVALMNPHLLQRIGFVCLSYSGLQLLGLITLNGTGLNGVALTAANLAPTIAALILIISWITSRANSVLIQDFGAIWNKYPLLSVIFLLLALAVVGFPGLNLFPGLFLIIGGVIQTQPIWAALALIAFLILATGMLWMFQKIFTGKMSPAVESFRQGEEMLPGRILIPITALIIWFGFFPQYIIRSCTESTDTVNRYVQSKKVFKKTSPGMTPMEHFFRQNTQGKD